MDQYTYDQPPVPAAPDVDLARSTAALRDRLLEQLPQPGKKDTALSFLHMVRRDSEEFAENCFYHPSLGLVVQGRKRALVGREVYEYGENKCLLVSVDVPSSFHSLGGSPQAPFLAVSLDLDPALIAQLALEMPKCARAGAAREQGAACGICVTDVTVPLLDAFGRLLDLLHQPQDMAFLGPVIQREIHYRLLTGPLGADLLRFCRQGSQSGKIAQAVGWLRTHFREALRVEDLARRVGMGTSTFYRAFREVTSMCPLQYHKRLRLYEAQRLMLVAGTDAASACYAVGYESPTQFSREYKRMFGRPPRQDILARFQTG